MLLLHALVVNTLEKCVTVERKLLAVPVDIWPMRARRSMFRLAYHDASGCRGGLMGSSTNDRSFCTTISYHTMQYDYQS